MNGAPVVVTGATGFIGRVICARLQADGFSVLACARHQAEGPWDDFLELDIAKPPREPWPLPRGSVVVHAAGLAHDTAGIGFTPAEYEAANAGGAATAANAVVACGGRGLVLLSSVKAMADRTGPTPMTMDAACRPATPYGVSKYRGEVLANALLAEIAPLAILRLAPVYGNGTKGNLDRLVRIARRRWVPLLPGSTGQRSMVHVEDIAALVAEIVAQPRPLTMVVTDGRRYSVRDIQDHVRGRLGRRTIIDRIWAHMVVPAAVLRALGALGSAGRRVTGRRMPFTSDDASRILDNALYASEVPPGVSWRPTRTLWDIEDSPPPSGAFGTPGL